MKGRKDPPSTETTRKEVDASVDVERLADRSARKDDGSSRFGENESEEVVRSPEVAVRITVLHPSRSSKLSCSPGVGGVGVRSGGEEDPVVRDLRVLTGLESRSVVLVDFEESCRSEGSSVVGLKRGRERNERR